MKLVFMHGWSFDASFWHPVCHALGQCDMTLLERGYSGARPFTTLPDQPFVLVTHSAGTLWALRHSLPQCRKIIAFNGFARFSQADDFPQGLSIRVLTRMRTRLARTTNETVMQFRRQFTPFIPCPPHLDLPVLDEGLVELMEGDGRATAHSLGRSLMAIHGTDDELVSGAMHEASFPDATRLIFEGGHLLPFTAPHQCAAIISNALRDVS